MAQWFTCEILLDLQFESEAHEEPLFFSIASLPNDPGLHPGDKFKVIDASLIKARSLEGERRRSSSAKRFTFDALVKKREKILTVDEALGDQVMDTLTLCIYVEVADKEEIPAMREEIDNL